VSRSAPRTLEDIRAAELDLARPWLPSAGRILELGGGSGFQAGILDGWGYEVVSLDVPERPAPARTYRPVEIYDGRNIPADAGAFDAVFSSNVLEHVGDLGFLLGEVARVLRPGGTGVHLMPSASWRLWTLVAHYPWALGQGAALVAGRRRELPGGGQAPPAALWRRGLIQQPHGEFPSALHELRSFSAASWRRTFEGAGYEVVQTSANGLFYTGYLLFGGLVAPHRERLAKLLGSSCNLFVTRPRA
jgi:SAM-dependent methyltransferase